MLGEPRHVQDMGGSNAGDQDVSRPGIEQVHPMPDADLLVNLRKAAGAGNSVNLKTRFLKKREAVPPDEASRTRHEDAFHNSSSGGLFNMSRISSSESRSVLPAASPRKT